MYLLNYQLLSCNQHASRYQNQLGHHFCPQNASHLKQMMLQLNGIKGTD
jgi:hypothetical protein